MFEWKGDRIDKLSRAHTARNFASYSLLFAAFGAMVFFGVCDPKSNDNVAPGGTAAVVGSQTVTASEFKRFYGSTLERFRASDANFDPGSYNLSMRVMDYLIGERAAFERAKNIGVVASKVEVEQVILEQTDRFRDENGKFSAELFSNYLKRNGYTEASFIEEQQRSMTMQKLEQFVEEMSYISPKSTEFQYRQTETKLDVEFVKIEQKDVSVTVSDEEVTKFLDDKGKEEVKKYFDGNQREFNSPAEVKARHILVQFEGSRNAAGEAAKRKKDEAKKRAEEILASVKASGADFAKIASEKTDEESGKKKGGDLGWFKSESMVKEFSSAAFGLKAGEISGLVESPFGFHIIKVDDKKEEKKVELAAATNDIARKLIEKQKKPELVKAEAAAVFADVSANKSLSSKYSWKATGEFAANAKGIPGLGSDQIFRDSVLKLAKVGQLSSEPIVSGQNWYILRLKSRKDADMAKLDTKKREELAQSEGYMLARASVTNLKSNALKMLQDKKRVWTNAEFAEFDSKRGTEDQASAE